MNTDTVSDGARADMAPSRYTSFSTNAAWARQAPARPSTLRAVAVRAGGSLPPSWPELPCAVGIDDPLICGAVFGRLFLRRSLRAFPLALHELPVVDAALPEGHEDVRAPLDLAGPRGWAVVPFGGGTSVADGVDVTDRLTVGVAFWRMNRVHHLDPGTGEVLVGPGITGPNWNVAGSTRVPWGHIRAKSWERAQRSVGTP